MHPRLLAVAGLIAICFALPFGVAALADEGPKPRPASVTRSPVQTVPAAQPSVRISALRDAPSLPGLRRTPRRTTPEAPSAPVSTTEEAPAFDAPFTPAPAPPAPAVRPAPSPRPSTSGGSTTPKEPSSNFDSGGTNEDFDSSG